MRLFSTKRLTEVLVSKRTRKFLLLVIGLSSVIPILWIIRNGYTVIPSGNPILVTYNRSEPEQTVVPKHAHHEQTACSIPRLDPLDPEILPYISHPRSFNCTPIQQPVVSHLDPNGTIVLNDTIIAQFAEQGNFTCTLCKLKPGRENSWSHGRALPIDLKTTQVAFPRDVDSVELRCRLNEKQVYFDALAYPRITQRMAEGKIKASSVDHPSVVIWFLDGVALNMFRRHLPKTYDYFQEAMGFRFLRGHVKVGDNSFPNMIPFFTGLRAGDQGEGLSAEIKRGRSQRYDDVKLIWQEYEIEGYATSYFEDWPWLGIFLMETGGFEAANPAEHYYLAYNRITENQKNFFDKKSTQFCFGNDAKYERYVDVLRHTLRHYHGKRIWAAHMFAEMTHPIEVNHPYASDLERADELFSSFWREVYEEGYLNETIVIAMADHGARYPPFRHLHIGRLEDKLPLLSYYLPPAFKAKYPHVDRALADNEWRLTTHFDSHKTMLDILDGNFENPSPQEQGGSRALSQFKPLPPNRTCKNAQVPFHYCACSTFEPADTTTQLVQDASRHIIYHLNSLLQPYPQCAQLQLRTIISSEIETPNAKVRENATSDWTRLRIAIKAAPSGAKVEATVSVSSEAATPSGPSRRFHINNVVDRINAYGSQSRCVKDHLLRLYCYCLDDAFSANSLKKHVDVAHANLAITMACLALAGLLS